MTISFPLSLPSSPKPSRIMWGKQQIVAVSSSPYTFRSQVFEYAAGRWLADISFDPMTRAQAAPFWAFIDSLRGRYGTFLLGDYLTSTPLGTAAGSPLVKGASQTGYVLLADGFTAGATLKAGDYFQIDNSMYQNLVDATADGGGNMTLDIWPNLRGHADNATIITSSAKCLMRLTSNEQTVLDAPQNKLYSIGLTAEEAL